jgi:UDP-2,3-diacylglucosamine pyrophosphatase LpxH
MSVSTQDIILQNGSDAYPMDIPDRWQASIEDRIEKMANNAYQVEFDDSSRFVFFSDCHRGDNGGTDAFSKNEPLFLSALKHYADNGFTYVEVGDGDELWQNPQFDRIYQAHASTFDLLHRLAKENQLYMLFGNHDIQCRHTKYMKKDGLPDRECLKLKYTKSSQSILVFHGHQTDPLSDVYAAFSRFAVRSIWRQLLRFNLARDISYHNGQERHSGIIQYIVDRVKLTKSRIEERLASWAYRHHQMIICGHTHQPISAEYGHAPYFNTGSCVEPNLITGLEIIKGAVLQVRWVSQGDEAKREVVVPPRQLSQYLMV